MVYFDYFSNSNTPKMVRVLKSGMLKANRQFNSRFNFGLMLDILREKCRKNWRDWNSGADMFIFEVMNDEKKYTEILSEYRGRLKNLA